MVSLLIGTSVGLPEVLTLLHINKSLIHSLLHRQVLPRLFYERAPPIWLSILTDAQESTIPVAVVSLVILVRSHPDGLGHKQSVLW